MTNALSGHVIAMLRQILKRAVIRGARGHIGHRMLLGRILEHRHVTVINLHRVSPEPNEFYRPLHPQVFDTLVGFLTRHFRIATLAEIDAQTNDPRPVAVLSFDDGFHDFVEYVMPVLHSYGVRANQNVIVSSVLTGRPPWAQRVNDFLARAPRSALAELGRIGFAADPPGEGRLERARYATALNAHLRDRPRAERQAMLAQVDPLLEEVAAGATRMMDVAELRQAAGSHEIGAHSYDHDTMSFESLEFFGADMQRCRDFFRETFGEPLRIYAFPSGLCRQEQLDLLLADPVIRTVLLVGDRYARHGERVVHRFYVAATDPSEVLLEALGYRAYLPG